MQQYIQGILYISIFIVIVELILPNSSLKKFITVIVSLIIIITVVSPIYNFATNEVIEKVDDVINILSNPDDFSSIMDESDIDISEYSSKTILSRLKSSLEESILQSVSRDLTNVAEVDGVNINLDEKNHIEEITIYISNVKVDTIDEITEILDDIISKYNVPKNLLTIIKK